MEENTNKTIAINTIFLYVRLFLTAICALLTTRFALKALGVVDFGLFSVLGSVISFITLFNTIMLSTSNRFIAVAIGKGEINAVRNQFNVNLIIHVGIAIATLLVAIPVGDWYVANYLNFDGDLIIARDVLNITIIGSVISFIAVPYNGLLMAKEKFSVFCTADVVAHLLKMLASLSIIYFFKNKLIVYSIGISVCSALPTLVYYIYCKKKYPEIVNFKICRDKAIYKEVFSFSVWVGFGAFATVGRSQGAAILVNKFFNTIMNTALGVSQSISSLISVFAQNVTQPIAPQITKNYASGNIERCNSLLVMNTKLSFLTMLFISSPFLIEPDFILKLWLGDVPPFAVLFMTLQIIDILISSLNAGISNIIFASGKIKLYQLLVNTNRILAVIFAYFVLKAGTPSYYLLYSYILFTVINLFVIQWVLHRTLHFDNSMLIKQSYIPCIISTILALPAMLLSLPFHPLVNIVISMIYITVCIAMVGLSKSERLYLYNIVKKRITR